MGSFALLQDLSSLEDPRLIEWDWISENFWEDIVPAIQGHIFLSFVSVAIALAISPAAAPPIPSATMKSEPRSPDRCVRTSGCSVALSVVRSATTNASSLCSRDRPTSVRPKTCTVTRGVGTVRTGTEGAEGFVTRAVAV